jgi:hypothetical protein
MPRSEGIGEFHRRTFPFGAHNFQGYTYNPFGFREKVHTIQYGCLARRKRIHSTHQSSFTPALAQASRGILLFLFRMLHHIDIDIEY